MKKKTIVWALLPVAALLVACGGSNSSSSQPASSSSASASSSQPASSASSSAASSSASQSSASSQSSAASSESSQSQSSEISSQSSQSQSSSSSQEPVEHLEGYAPVSSAIETRDFDERFDVMVDDFSGDAIQGTTTGTLHEGYLRALVDSNLDSFPNTTDGAIYKAASGSYEAMNFGANGIGFKMRVSRGRLGLANLRLELRGGDGYQTYRINLNEARNSDNEELPELTNEFQDILINPGQTIEDENTVYKNLDGTDSEQTVLGMILGFHLVANDLEVGAEIEIEEVFTYSGVNRVVLDDFNRADVSRVPDAWWGGSASGFIVRRGVALGTGKTYMTPALADKQYLVITAMGDSSSVTFTGYDAQGEELIDFAWSEALGVNNPLVPLANGGYGNYAINLAQLSGNGILSHVAITANSGVEIAGVFLTSFEVPQLDLVYPHIAVTSVLDTFDRNIASLSPDWDASAAIQANIEAGVTGFVSYNHGDQIYTENGSLHLPAAASPDYAQVTIGYADELLDVNAKYVVIAAKGEDLNLMRFKFRGGGSDTEVWFNAGLANEGVKAYGNNQIPSPYVDNGGFTHYVFNLAQNGLGVTGIFDLYYTGENPAEIGSIYFANDDFSLFETGRQACQVGDELDLTNYAWVGNMHAPDARFFGIEIAEASDADYMSLRVEKGGSAIWLKDGVLKAYFADGTLVDPTAAIPATGTTIYVDMESAPFPAENDGYVHLHVGGGFTGIVKFANFIAAMDGFAKSFGGSDPVTTTGGYVYCGGFLIDAAYDYLSITVKATGTNMTFDSLRIESPDGSLAYFNNPNTCPALHLDGTPVSGSDVIPEEGVTVVVDVANSWISLAAGQRLHVHYADWGNPSGTIQVLDVTGIARVKPYNLIFAELPA